jgi:hypothetical protein
MIFWLQLKYVVVITNLLGGLLWFNGKFIIDKIEINDSLDTIFWSWSLRLTINLSMISNSFVIICFNHILCWLNANCCCPFIDIISNMKRKRKSYSWNMNNWVSYICLSLFMNRQKQPEFCDYNFEFSREEGKIYDVRTREGMQW